MDQVGNLSEKVQCPFDRSHVMERRRLQQHLGKCFKNLPPNHDFVVCQFYNLHYVRKGELDKHHEECEHGLRKLAQKRQEMSQPSRFKQPKLIEDEGLKNCYSDESWEDIPNSQPAFKPEALQAQAPYMITPQGLSKAKRRAFREQERKRLRELEESQVHVKTPRSTESWDDPPRKPELPPVNPGVAPPKLSQGGHSSLSSSGYSSTSSSRQGYSNDGPSSSSSSYSTSFTMGGPTNRSDPRPGNAPFPSSAQSRPPAGRGFLGEWATNSRQTHQPHSYHYSHDDFPHL